MQLRKIGIITLHGYYNYGNRLQNFALKKVIENFGFNVDTTVIKDNTFRNRARIIKKNPKLIIPKMKSIFRKKNKSIANGREEVVLNRESKFKEFSKLYLSESFYNLGSDSQKLREYSFFVTGSDQVWNPVYYQVLPIYFLTFIENDKRVAYAPSISRNKLPKEYLKDYKEWLRGMNSLSVREVSGANIIKELTGIEAPILVDPTMLLTKDEWLSISERATNRPDTSYLLTYFLGGPTDETKLKLEEIANENNMTVINLGDITEKETYETGPSEFLDYINNASAFFTDSFHGVVFSIIFQTPFIVFERQSSGSSMYSRIETILDNFDMRNREANGFNEDVFSMDFSGTHEVLEREYDKSIEYLKKALRIEE